MQLLSIVPSTKFEMRIILIALLAFSILSCNQRVNNSEVADARIDSLETKISDIYKPGFGEFMSGIQAHHSKLWFAGQNQNWKLADFEIHEILESITDIQKYQAERKESMLIQMIIPALDSVTIAIQQKNAALFIISYTSLTNTCNKCHQATDFEFNIVKIPDNQTFSNQNFKPVQNDVPKNN
jgi:hypothetical protein